MPRYKQVVREDGSSEFVEIGASSSANHGPAIQAFEPFVSPVDGSVISDRRQLAEHNKRHNVVQQQEFGTAHYERKRKEREAHYTGQHSPEAILRRKQQLNEIINHIERKG